MYEHYLRLKLNILSSDLDKSEDPNKAYLRYIDPNKQIMEFSIIKLFQIRLLNLIQNKVALAKNFHIAPSELDRMYYWEYEYLLEEVNNNIKSENERTDKETSKYKDFNPNSAMRDARSMIPKSSGFSAPKIPSMPSFGH